MRLVPVIDLMSPMRLRAALVSDVDFVRNSELMLDSETLCPSSPAREFDIAIWPPGLKAPKLGREKLMIRYMIIIAAASQSAAYFACSAPGLFIELKGSEGTAAVSALLRRNAFDVG
jgi:hypothetical protein